MIDVRIQESRYEDVCASCGEQLEDVQAYIITLGLERIVLCLHCAANLYVLIGRFVDSK